MVKDYGARTWGFPKGKINEAEPEMKCAIREVLDSSLCMRADGDARCTRRQVVIFLITCVKISF